MLFTVFPQALLQHVIVSVSYLVSYCIFLNVLFGVHHVMQVFSYREIITLILSEMKKGCNINKTMSHSVIWYHIAGKLRLTLDPLLLKRTISCAPGYLRYIELDHLDGNNS